ncbi:hypothetical protein P7C70_g4332, partial [Phenoliferia sp. Uapishka_3]
MDDEGMRLIVQNQQLVALGFLPVLAHAASRGAINTGTTSIPTPARSFAQRSARRNSRSAPEPLAHPAFSSRSGARALAAKPYGPFRAAPSIRAASTFHSPSLPPAGGPGVFINHLGHLSTTGPVPPGKPSCEDGVTHFLHLLVRTHNVQLGQNSGSRSSAPRSPAPFSAQESPASYQLVASVEPGDGHRAPLWVLGFEARGHGCGVEIVSHLM